MPQSASELHRWEIPNVAQFRPGRGGLQRLVITGRFGSAEIYLLGAHVTHFQPVGHSPALFMSDASNFAPGKAIRGGVPVIFPWFGGRTGFPESPAHGFARTAIWDVETIELWPNQAVHAVLKLTSSDETRSLWPHDFVLRHRITVGRELEMALEVENWSSEAFTYEEALHTYLAVRDVRHVAVTGLAGAEFLDKTDEFKRKIQGPEPITITAETDRVYLGSRSICTVDDSPAGRRIHVSKEGSDTTVVWNPWIAKAAALADFGDDEWPKMICIETANAAENAVTLAPGESHTMRAKIAVEL